MAVAVWGSCDIGKLQCGDVAVLGSCSEGELWCVAVTVRGSCGGGSYHVFELRCK